MHAVAAQAGILCHPGRISQGTLTALLVLMWIGRVKSTLFLILSEVVEVQFKISFVNLLYFYMTTEFLNVLAIQFFNHMEWRWKTSVSDKPSESCSSGKWSGGKIIYAHIWREENCWACSKESETVHQPTLQWLYLLKSTRGNQYTVTTGKAR